MELGSSKMTWCLFVVIKSPTLIDGNRKGSLESSLLYSSFKDTCLSKKEKINRLCRFTLTFLFGKGTRENRRTLGLRRKKQQRKDPVEWVNVSILGKTTTFMTGFVIPVRSHSMLYSLGSCPVRGANRLGRRGVVIRRTWVTKHGEDRRSVSQSKYDSDPSEH